MAKERADQPREEQLEELVRIESKVSEAAEAAADAAAHAVEATKAAEAASVARAARKAKAATTAKAAKAAKTAKSNAAKASKAAKAAMTASTPTAFNPPPPKEPRKASQSPTHAVELKLTGDELEQIVRLAAEKDLPVPELARSLLVRSLGQTADGVGDGLLVDSHLEVDDLRGTLHLLGELIEGDRQPLVAILAVDE